MKRATTTDLQALHEERERLLLELQVEELRRVTDPSSRFSEAWGDQVDNRDYLYDTPGFGGGDNRNSLSYDRRDGDNPPHWTSEQEHARYRGIARFLIQTDETVIGALGGLTSYCIGTGGSVAFAQRGVRGETNLTRAVDSCWQSFVESAGWSVASRREAFLRWRGDGELGLWVRAISGQRLPELIVVEPEWITEPTKPEVLEEHYGLPAANWKYGVARTDDWSERMLGVFAERYGIEGDWEWISDRALVWSKINTVQRVKRGVGDLMPVFTNVERAAKLLGNTAQGAAIQAAIAYIRDHGSKQSASGVLGAATYDGSFQRPTQTGPKTVRTKRFLPGTVIDTNGASYAAGPVGAGAGAGFLQIVQGVLRIVGSRWNMPEYLISGDASNANYASSLVAESPFVKACEGIQQQWIDDVELPLVWRVLSVACAMGAFAAHGCHTVEDLRAAVEVTVTLPEVQSRDRAAENAARQAEFDRGVLSAETWCEEVGRDWETEQQRGAAPQTMSSGGLAPGAASSTAVPVLTPQQIGEELRRAVRESWGGYYSRSN